MKTLITATLLGSVAMAGTAFAQTAAPETTDPAMQTEGMDTAPGTEVAPAGEPGMETGMTGDAGMASEEGFYTYQEGNQMLGSGLMGADVWGSDGESIGSVDDILLDSDGQVIAVVVGVGGFLGIGQKDVAISTDRLEFVLAQDAAAAEPTDPAMAPADPAAPAADPAAPAAETVPADPAVPDGDAMATDPAVAPGAAPADQAAGTTAPATGTMGETAGTADGRWGWTGAGIERIEVAYTRDQLDAAPEFESAE